MAINFNKELNDEIRNTIRNFNKRRDRLENLGYKNLPEHMKVREIKELYSDRKTLLKQLDLLRSFTRKDLSSEKELSGGVKTNIWNYKYLMANRKEAIKYFQSEFDRVNKRVGKYPGERLYVDNIAAKLEVLNTPVQEMTSSEYRAALATINEFIRTPSIRSIQYRNYLKEVDWIMGTLGYSKQEKDKFFKKFSVLTPSQFLYAYENSDLITRIYDLYHKDYGEPFLTASEEYATELIDEFMQQIDIIIKDAQTNMD